jgi:hypothetical protein
METAKTEVAGRRSRSEVAVRMGYSGPRHLSGRLRRPMR